MKYPNCDQTRNLPNVHDNERLRCRRDAACVAGLRWRCFEVRGGFARALFLAKDTLNRPGCLHARACEPGPDPDVRVDLSLDLQKKFDPRPTRNFFFECVPKLIPEVFG